MNPKTFYLRPIGSLTATDFQISPLWAGYYEPDDIDEIVRWGTSEDVVRSALDAIGWEDDHYFPLPIKAANSIWMRGKLYGVIATTPNGMNIYGYKGESNSYVVLFINDESFVLSDDTPYELTRLSTIIGGASVLPLRVRNRVTGEMKMFELEA